jgi:predicted nucleic acid-binding protein
MTDRVVLDASAALAWLIQGQQTPASIAFAAQTAGDELLAPICFRCETRHALLKLERRGLLDATQVISDLAMLESRMTFDFDSDPAAQMARLAAIETLSRAEQIAFFHASYLELALRVQSALATRDSALAAATQRRGLHVHDLR